MAYMFVRHRVKNYSEWKDGFDAAEDFRKSSGELSHQIFSVNGDNENLVVLVEYSSIEEAQKFAASEDLKKAMEEVGVIEKPDIYFLQKLANG